VKRRDVDGYHVAWEVKQLVDRMNILQQTTAKSDHKQAVSGREDQVAWLSGRHADCYPVVCRHCCVGRGEYGEDGEAGSRSPAKKAKQTKVRSLRESVELGSGEEYGGAEEGNNE